MHGQQPPHVLILWVWLKISILSFYYSYPKVAYKQLVANYNNNKNNSSNKNTNGAWLINSKFDKVQSKWTKSTYFGTTSYHGIILLDFNLLSPPMLDSLISHVAWLISSRGYRGEVVRLDQNDGHLVHEENVIKLTCFPVQSDNKYHSHQAIWTWEIHRDYGPTCRLDMPNIVPTRWLPSHEANQGLL